MLQYLKVTEVPRKLTLMMHCGIYILQKPMVLLTSTPVFQIHQVLTQDCGYTLMGVLH